MDTQTNNIINQPLINPTPTPEIKASPLTRITNWVNTHRKLSLIILGGFLLAVVIIIMIFPTIKNSLFNQNQTPPTSSTNQEQSSELGSIILTSPKTTFPVTEKIPISVMGDTNGSPIAAFDIVIEYDPEFLTLTQQKNQPLQEFLYYSKGGEQIISVAAVQKPDSQTPQIFKNTTLFGMEFTPKKPGKTVLKMVYSPNSTSDSNLLDPANKDILSIVRGMEIIIN